jgi:NADPH:quinone reductase-like Zn-dependent oxidoreductase
VRLRALGLIDDRQPLPARAELESAMKAIVREPYGPLDVLRLAEVPQPLPKAGEALVQVRVDHVIDNTQADFIRNRQRYDLIVAVNGYRSILACRRALRPGGRHVLVGASNARLA